MHLLRAIRSYLLGFVVAVAGVAVVTGLKLAVPPLGHEAPSLLYLLCVVVAALTGGWASGLAATALSAVAMEYFFLEPFPRFALAPSGIVATAVFAAEGVLIASLSAAVRSGRERIAAAMDSQAAQQQLLELVQSTTMSLSRTATQEEVARVFVEGASIAFGARAGMLWRATESGALALVHWTGLNDDQVARYRCIPPDSPMPAMRALLDGTDIWVESTEEFAQRYPEAEAIDRPIRSTADVSFFIAPLAMEHRRLGVLAFGFSGKRSFSVTERRFVLALAEQTAQALHRVELLAVEKRGHEEADRSAQAAIEASRCKDEFLAMLSHELRTPLSAILGWTRILRARPIAEDVLRSTEVIERNALAQLRLVEDMLDVSRIVAGKMHLERTRIDLADVLRAALSAVAPAASAKDIVLESSIGAAPCKYDGDAVRLQQVFWNLLSNAIKFTPPGGRVTASLERDGSRFRVVVRDTGCGIRREFLPYVFDRFRQADCSTTRAERGLGLGLAIVRHVVELHGGTVRAESPGAGCGATFSVDLPSSGVEGAAAIVKRERGVAEASSTVWPAALQRLLLDHSEQTSR